MKSRIIVILSIIIMIFNIGHGDVIEYNNNRVYPDTEDMIDISTVETVNDYYIKDKDRYYGLRYHIMTPVIVNGYPERLYMREKNVLTTVSIKENPVKIKDEYFFSKDKVYYRGEEIKGADPKTIKLLSNGVSKDGENIYFENRMYGTGKNFRNIGENYFRDDDGIYVVYYRLLGQLNGYPYHFEKMDKIDAETAKVLRKNYIKDKDSIYYIDARIEGADMKSFKVLDEFYSKDKNNVYFKAGKIEGADAETFKPLQYWYSRDKNNLYGADEIERKISSGDVEIFNRHVYRVDGKYYMQPFYGKAEYDEEGRIYGKGVGEADGNLELKKLDEVFFILGDKLYYRDLYGVHLMDIEEPENFKRIEYSYYTDGKDVYYFFHKLEGLDKASMKILNEYTLEDKNYRYYGQFKTEKGK